jgi:hypothetical protein
VAFEIHVGIIRHIDEFVEGTISRNSQGFDQSRRGNLRLVDLTQGLLSRATLGPDRKKPIAIARKGGQGF